VKTELLKTAKPIRMSTQQVRAILDGRMNETRRPIKDPWKVKTNQLIVSDIPFGVPLKLLPGEYKVEHNQHGTVYYKFSDGQTLGLKPSEFEFIAPYQKGDILFVRETWAHDDAWYDDEPGLEWKNIHRNGKCTWVDYKATETQDEVERWRPSIHMPRWAVRLFLRVTDIRVEKLQDITSSGIEAEGTNVENLNTGEEYRQAFKSLWTSTVKKQDIGKYDWDPNPWVRVTKFERVEAI
jgi:hypothetical protein